MNILIVEDEACQAKVFARQVKIAVAPTACGIQSAVNFREAVNCAKANPLSLALCDIQLGDDEYGGIRAAEAMQLLQPVPIIFITGSQKTRVIQEAKQVAHFKFLKKPFDPHGLRSTIRAAAQQAAAQTQNAPVGGVVADKGNCIIKTDRSAYMKVAVERIVCVEAMDQYCLFYLDGEAHPVIAKKNLKRDVFDGMLSAYPSFFMLRRSLIINLRYVQKIQQRKIGIGDVQLKNKKNFGILADKKKAVIKAWNALHRVA